VNEVNGMSLAFVSVIYEEFEGLNGTWNCMWKLLESSEYRFIGLIWFWIRCCNVRREGRESG
jgi:hypothetical protein